MFGGPAGARWWLALPDSYGLCIRWQTAKVILESHDESLEVTIVRSRYGGIYEPGKWIAFAMSPGDLPPDWNGDDTVCMDFFQSRRGEVGGGETPQEAYEDLLRLFPGPR